MDHLTCSHPSPGRRRRVRACVHRLIALRNRNERSDVCLPKVATRASRVRVRVANARSAPSSSHAHTIPSPTLPGAPSAPFRSRVWMGVSLFKMNRDGSTGLDMSVWVHTIVAMLAYGTSAPISPSASAPPIVPLPAHI